MVGVKETGEVVLSAEKNTRYLCNSWPEYYQEFPYFSDQTVRPGCHPRKLLHDNRVQKAIVLIHGLTDSPYYMMAIADYFHNFLGYNVYLPLLQCHGLKNPAGMTGASLAEWKKNVRFAVQSAAESADRVSIGGLSMGGALSVYFGCSDPQITGHLFLFSAALGLYGGRLNVYGGLLEFLLKSPFFRFLDNWKLLNGKPLEGSHPYRYDRVPFNSARELVQLLQEVNGLLKPAGDIVSSKRIFNAWSECDKVINVRKLHHLKTFTKECDVVSFIIPAVARVAHACVVLKEKIHAIGSQPGDTPLEIANPLFVEMMAALHKFESAG